MALQDFVGLGTSSASLETLGIVGGVLLVVVLIWSVIWKGLALWKSARKNHMIWFIILLVVNTLGILEILYIFIFSKMGGKGKTAKPLARQKKKKR